MAQQAAERKPWSYIQTVSLKDFARIFGHNVSEIEILQNEGKKPFFNCGGITGYVSGSAIEASNDERVVSVCNANDGNKNFFCMHKKGTGGASVVEKITLM